MARYVFPRVGFLVAILLTGCTSTGHRSRFGLADPLSPVVINDQELQAQFGRGMEALLKKTPDAVAYTVLTQQLSRTSCALELPPVKSRRMDPSEVYRDVIDSVVIVGKFYHCRSKNCTKLHFGATSGVIIREDGVVLTNYHVVETDQPKMLGLAIMTYAGEVFLVDEVLAADELNDIAILKLRDASNLAAVPIFRDEPVGRPVTVISHPSGQFYTLTQGYVSRYCEKDARSIMNVTADYAKGSSGGPIFNDRGDLVGLVSSTISLSAGRVPLALGEDEKTLRLADRKNMATVHDDPLIMNMNHQMTIHTSVPSRAILDLITPCHGS